MRSSGSIGNSVSRTLLSPTKASFGVTLEISLPAIIDPEFYHKNYKISNQIVNVLFPI